MEDVKAHGDIMPAPRGLVQQVDQALHRDALLPRGGRLLVAVSGGADSVALLLALPVLLAKLAVGGFLMALIETRSAKMRLFRVPEFLGTAFLLAVIGLLVNILLGAS